MPSGIYGLVNSDAAALSTVEMWELTDTKTSDSYVASNTYNGTVRGGGIRSWSGSFNGRGFKPPVMPGDTFNFKGYTEPTSGTEGTTGITYEGSAICSGVTIDWNWQTNQIFQWNAEFSGLPGLVISTQVPVLDASIPPIDATCGTKVEYESSTPGTYIEIPSLVSASLNITSALSSEANSSTIANGECWESFNKGPIDWTLSLPQEDYQRGVDGAPLMGGFDKLRIYVDATDFWQLKFGVIQGYSGLTVDRNTGATIARTIDYSMAASDGTEVGNIVFPGDDPTSTVYWGVPDSP